jgi:3-phosphoshikimate 1-carboxyvinyltransferase
MGAEARVEGSRLLIRGVAGLKGAMLSSYNDHRVLMSLAVAATRACGETLLTYPNAYRISYPEFLEAMNHIGACMECVD